MDQLRDIPTKAANEAIAGIRDKDGFFKAITGMEQGYDTRFVRDVTRFMKKTGMTRRRMDVLLSPVMSRAHMYSLLNGNRQPNRREHVIAIGLSLSLSVEEMNILLKDAGLRGLDAKRSRGDTVAIFGITQKMDLDDINDMLHTIEADYVLYD